MQYLRRVILLLAIWCGTLALYAQNNYADFQTMSTRLKNLVATHSNRASIRSLGTTSGGRELWAVTVGSGKTDEHPAVLVVGGVEGSKIVDSELAVRFLEVLLADDSDSVKSLLTRMTFYVLPRVNPDATEQRFAGLRYERDRNTTASDDDRDGQVNEDGFEDLNGDGQITWMRVRSAAGNVIADLDDPRVMRQVDAARGERGTHELYTEGRDNDGDGRYNEDGEGGVNFNNNFTFNYPYFKLGAGEYQVSEIETRAVADFCYDHQNIAVVFAFSPQNNLLNPWDAKPSPDGPRGRGGGRITTTVREGDAKYMKRIADLYNEITSVRDGPLYLSGEGSFVEWAYYHFGRWSFGTNGWWIPKPAQDSTIKKGSKEKSEKKNSDVDGLRWLESQGVSDAFVPWKRINHLDFPNREVDVGGFTPFIRSNPPSQMLDSLGRMNARFIGYLGGLLPRIEPANLRVERLAVGVTRITMDVVNTGFLPTISEMGQTSRVPLTIKVEVSLGSGQSVVTGRRVQLLEPIAGSGGMRTLSWVVTGSGSTTISVAGPMTGGFTEQIELQ